MIITACNSKKPISISNKSLSGSRSNGLVAGSFIGLIQLRRPNGDRISNESDLVEVTSS